MGYIRSRKHSTSLQPAFRPSLVALAALALPLASQAQPAGAPDEALPEINVHSSAEAPYKADWVSSPKLTQPLVDTPQTVSVIKKEIIREQGATTLTEALHNTPGVGTFFLGENGSTNTGDAVFMRGFDSSGSIFVDGIRDLGSISRDVFNIEQIEVSKGPTGADYGRSSPTGSVNLVTKQPLMKDAYSGSLGIGSADYKRATADLNKTIGENSAFRVNLLEEKSGVAGRDVVENNREGVAAALGFGLGTSTRTYLNVLHVDQRNTPDGGVPTIGLPGYSSPDPARPFLSDARLVDPRNFYGSTSDYDNVNADMVTAIVEHDISPDTMLRNISRYGKTTQHYLLTSFMGSAANLLTPDPADPSTWTLARGVGNPLGRTLKDQENEILTNQTNITTGFDTGSIRHDLSAGLELIREKQTTVGYAGTGTLAAASLYHPNPDDPVGDFNPVRNGTGSDGETSTIGAYLFDTLKFGKRWQLLGGVRVDHYKTDYASTTLSTARSNPTLPVGTRVSTNLNDSGNLLNWKFAALYKPAENGSVYVSYATSQEPPGGSNFALSTSESNAGNPKFDPQNARTTEIGTKWELMNKRLSLTAALYDTEISNDIAQNPVDLLYYQTGKKQVKGVELGLVGEITSAWNASVGYTLMKAEVASGTGVAADGSNNLAYTPKQAFTAWSTCKLPHGWTIGGGARFVDALLRGTDGAIGTPEYTNSYWVFDAMATYKISKNVDLQLNLYNLTDKQYVAAINKSGYRYTPGMPRSAVLAANIKF